MGQEEQGMRDMIKEALTQGVSPKELQEELMDFPPELVDQLLGEAQRFEDAPVVHAMGS